MRFVAENFHLIQYNNSWKFQGHAKLKASCSLYIAERYIMRKSGFPSKKERSLKYLSFFEKDQDIFENIQGIH